MLPISQQTLASIVKNNYQVVPILEKYNLDFCCKGNRLLADACNEKGIVVGEIVRELETAIAAPERKSMPFTAMTAEQLIGHILIHHHFYVKQSMPVIYGHLHKVAAKHGDRFPYMREVFQLFSAVKDEMTTHLQKEELILFPRIKELEKLHAENPKVSLPANFIDTPIAVMETEHEHAGETMFKIRALTSNYTAPEEACTTFKVSLAELKEFEEDLHQHVHLENNILFQKAQLMMA
jgi:regulator of cell morphogenesis and NO signaling